jgi:hypothetical protein
MIIIALLLMCCGIASAQEYSEFHGTWIHSDVVQVLNETRSIERALAARPLSEPIYVVIDSTKDNGDVAVSYKLGSTQALLCRKSSFKHAGIKWGVGDATGPRWILTRDEKDGAYIALTLVDSLEQEPIVFGKLPSKNLDPMFIIRRMVNASMLSGRWTIEGGKTVEFTTNQIMVIDDKSNPYTLDISEDGSVVTLITTSGRPQTWKVRRDGPNLVLSSQQKGKGRLLPGQTTRLRYVGK